MSALLLASGVRARPAALAASSARGVLADTAAGFRLVFGRAALRAIALLVFAVVMLSIVVEGMAAVLAAHVHAGPGGQGVLMPRPRSGSRSAGCWSAGSRRHGRVFG